jgi:acyl-coenzyme A thioesterase 1/2/4
MASDMNSRRIRVTPERALQPTPISIVAEGFAPGSSVRLTSRLLDDAGVVWAAHADFIADAKGAVNTATAPSEAGTYTGTDQAGLLWSMRPEGHEGRSFMMGASQRAHKLGQPLLDPLKPLSISMAASQGDGSEVRALLLLDRLAEGIDVLPVRAGRQRGTLFRWRDRTRQRGAIVSLTGSGGGIEMGFAPVLASLGYDVFSLAYFAYEDLPPGIARLPLEYFEEAFAWLHDELGCERIAVQGASRGGELTLVLASYLPEWVKGAAAIVPMYASSAGWDPERAVAGPSWTFRGVDIPYAESSEMISMDEMRRIGEGLPNGYAATPAYRADLDRPEVRERCALPVERAGGPVLLISGVDDQMWPCAWGSDLVLNRLRAKGFAHPMRHLALPETGHITPIPNTITSLSPALFHSLANVFLACGGTAQGTARTSWQTWDALVSHYRTVFGH